MSVEIWVAIITSVGALAGTFITVAWGNKKNAERSKQQTDVTLYRIAELERKQEKYNNLQERVMREEADIKLVVQAMNDIKELIEYLHAKE